ncbi:MAG TPA: hypothetical protein DCW49_09705 [Alteromonas australica]|nr:hypothetical protein [Alteromonas australica]|tara:strand:- start:74 stop:274 length:201 start_codon:yes stop_codon:yes gene_type:complete
MYQAVIVACLLSNPGECIYIEAQSWHSTERACQSEAINLASKVHIYMPLYKPMQFICKELKKGSLS